MRARCGLVWALGMLVTAGCGLDPYTAPDDDARRAAPPPAPRAHGEPAEASPGWLKLTEGPTAIDPRHCQARWVGEQLVLWSSPLASEPCVPQRWDAESQWRSLSSGGSPALEGWTLSAAGDRLMVYGWEATQTNRADCYDLLSDSWQRPAQHDLGGLPTDMVPLSTGEGAIFWGGHVMDSDLVEWQMPEAAIYYAESDSWTPLSRDNEPAGRSRHATNWDGMHMMVFGGVDLAGNLLGDGYLWDESSNTWELMPGDGGPSARADAASAFTGTYYFVFGGSSDGDTFVADGGLYHWAQVHWETLPAPPDGFAPRHPVAFFTGELVMVLQTDDAPIQVASFEPVAKRWEAVELDPEMEGLMVVRADYNREVHRVLVWGYHCDDATCSQRRWEAWAYDPQGEPPPPEFNQGG